MVIYNVPQEIIDSGENRTSSKPRLGLIPGDIEAKFICTGLVKMVTEVGSDTRKKLPHKKLKLGWLICNVDDYIVAK